ncbi:YfiT family bacillithiol transferase [Hymenobacter actinosclerus]|uniref:DinB superfamily protein n=1 Tax=Hymenobacter actinosclerus TaxID=82805 RepID=A0A1I0C3I3_9BACT|nr:putative metal-dependent hydrolase [Hymenobacter actinosclerus]SET13917.1 DinB superfamily protein [Hymenobacter actinosclerus]
MQDSDVTSDARYPIGQPELPSEPLEHGARTAYIAHLATLPDLVRAAVAGRSPEQLDQSYRPGGWSARQLLHHLPDSHLNAYLRFKLALTEDNPTIKPYDEAAWAELPDTAATPVAVSLALLESLHIRWVRLLRNLTDEQWQRTYFHPDSNRTFTLDQALVLYSWHGRHHLAHLRRAAMVTE